MPLVLVTGISGSGKSAVCIELERRGYDAHDTDCEGNAVWVHRDTGQALAMDAPRVLRPEWLDAHEWRLVRSRVESLASRVGDRRVFLCGMTANQDDFSYLFSKIVLLSIDPETLRRRVTTRTTNDFGKAEHELAAAVTWRSVVEDRYRESGAVTIDATLPLSDVVDVVLHATG